MTAPSDRKAAHVGGPSSRLPAGTWHEARSLDSFSLHLTIGVLTVTWAHVIRRVLADADGYWPNRCRSVSPGPSRLTN